MKTTIIVTLNPHLGKLRISNPIVNAIVVRSLLQQLGDIKSVKVGKGKRVTWKLK